jgi:hypothetical protein
VYAPCMRAVIVLGEGLGRVGRRAAGGVRPGEGLVAETGDIAVGEHPAYELAAGDLSPICATKLQPLEVMISLD